MGIIFDTTAIITIERSHESLDALIAGRGEELFGISIITTAELLHGVERADTEEKKLRRLAFVEKVIEFFPVFPFDLTVSRTPTISLSPPRPFPGITPSPRPISGILRRSRG